MIYLKIYRRADGGDCKVKNRYFILCLCLMPALLFPAITYCEDIDAQKAGIRFAAKQAAKVAVEELLNKDP